MATKKKVEDTEEIPQLNTLPRTFSPRPPEWGVNYRYHEEELKVGSFLGGELQVDEEAVKQAQEVAKINEKELPDLEGVDASFPGSAAGAFFLDNPQTNAATTPVTAEVKTGASVKAAAGSQ